VTRAAGLHKLVGQVDQLARQVAEIQTRLAALVAAEDRPETRPAKRKQRWVGPVDAATHAARVEVHLKRFMLAMQLGIDPRSNSLRRGIIRTHPTFHAGCR
jgi:hypothetical protein